MMDGCGRVRETRDNFCKKIETNYRDNCTVYDIVTAAFSIFSIPCFGTTGAKKVPKLFF